MGCSAVSFGMVRCVPVGCWYGTVGVWYGQLQFGPLSWGEAWSG